MPGQQQHWQHFSCKKKSPICICCTFVLLMSHTCQRKKWMTWVQKNWPKLQQRSFVGWKYRPYQEKNQNRVVEGDRLQGEILVLRLNIVLRNYLWTNFFSEIFDRIELVPFPLCSAVKFKRKIEIYSFGPQQIYLKFLYSSFTCSIVCNDRTQVQSEIRNQPQQ